MVTEYKYDVFISYSRKDYVDEATKEKIPNSVISIIKKSFDDNGITYWMDEEGNLTGKKFAHIIAGKIRESMVFLFICSKNSVASKWVDRELSVADTFDKHIIPFICDDSYKDDKVVMFTAALDRVEYFGKHNKNNEIEKLVKSVKKDKEEYEENRKKEEEILRQKQKEEEERKKREEQEKKKKEAVKEIKKLATDYRLHSLQQETIVQQLHEKNQIIGKEKKECPICKATSPIETTFCERCGFQFPQLYAIDGKESYPFDNRLLVTAKANYEAIVFAEKEKERLEKKVAELTDSFDKISKECELHIRSVAQKEEEALSFRKECDLLSKRLEENKLQWGKLDELRQQKEALEKRAAGFQKELLYEREKNSVLEKSKAKLRHDYEDALKRIQYLEAEFGKTESQKVSESDLYDVLLKDSGKMKLAVVKLVKETTGLGLSEAKELVDEAPDVLILEGIPLSKAYEVKSSFEEAGAMVGIVKTSGRKKKRIRSSQEALDVIRSCNKYHYRDLFSDDAIGQMIDVERLSIILERDYGIKMKDWEIRNCQTVGGLKTMILQKAGISIA